MKHKDVTLCGKVRMDRYLKLFKAMGKVSDDYFNNQKRKTFQASINFHLNPVSVILNCLFQHDNMDVQITYKPSKAL
jgi:hypothetical protein